MEPCTYHRTLRRGCPLCEAEAKAIEYAEEGNKAASIGQKAIAARTKWLNGFPKDLAKRLRDDILARQAFYHGYMIAAGAWEEKP